ncbi:MAG: superoxide dismutase family protein [Burkholderiales bacterium]|nr:superoxide dismutase family protein [Burkholderiales bacterium]
MKKIAFALLFLGMSAAHAEKTVIDMHLVDAKGVGKMIGHIQAEDSPYGLLLTPDLSDLTPGIHGFHVHQNPDCGSREMEGKMVPGLAAGGHYDPSHAEHHEGPYASGHLGDLPALTVDAEGHAKLAVLAPRLKVSDLKGRSLMIHAGGDNYSDKPALGGGGPRMACGVAQ